jgi:hypothetical protein
VGTALSSGCESTYGLPRAAYARAPGGAAAAPACAVRRTPRNRRTADDKRRPAAHSYGMTHSRTTAQRFPRTIDPAAVAVLALVGAIATVFVLFVAAVVFVHRTVQTSPSGTEETIGGLHYHVDNAWILDPKQSVDAPLAKGLPRADTRAGGHHLLYAVFVGVTNETGRRLPMATDVELRDTRNREYGPLPLGRDNAYAYRPVVMAPQTHQPAPSTPAARNLSAVGSMLVFRIPRRSYDDGPLELVVHDPAHPASVSTIQVA